MKPPYTDITSRIPDPPLWWTMEGVPRYEPFRPQMASNWGACEVVLLKIECACCRAGFLVEISILDKIKPGMDIEDMRYGYLNYRDPPYHTYNGNTCAGNTMTCDPVRIMEFWRCNDDFEWERVTEREIYLVD